MNSVRVLDYVYYETTKRVYSFDNNFHTILTWWNDFEVEKDFCIDRRTYEIMQRLKTNREITLTDTKITIKADEGKLTANLIEREKPLIHVGNYEYENTYNSEKIKRATKFVSDNVVRGALRGVMFNEKGGIASTDRYRMYAYGDVSDLKYSVPTTVFNYLVGEEIVLKFSQAHVVYETNEFVLIQSLYEGALPNLASLYDKYVNEENNDKIELDINLRQFLFTTKEVILEFANNELTFYFKDSVKEFKTTFSVESDLCIRYKFNYELLKPFLEIGNGEVLLVNGKDNRSPLCSETEHGEFLLMLPLALM